MAFSQERPHSFAEALKAAKRILSANHDLVKRGTVETEAEQIVLHAFRMESGKHLTRMELYSRVNDRFPELAGEQVLILSSARATGKLLQHLTGRQVFLDHEYEVSSDVLIPRPETELLVATILESFASTRGPLRGIEVGVGSGAISVE